MSRDLDLTQLAVELVDLRARLRREGHDLVYELSPGAQKEELDRCEALIGLRLPPNLRNVLTQHNGAAMSIKYIPGISHELYLYSVEDILAEDSRFRSTLTDLDREGRTLKVWTHDLDDPDHFWTGFIAFANYGVGVCLLDTDQRNGHECAVVDLDVDDTEATRKKVLADSLQSWFAQIFAAAEREQSFIYWLPHTDL